MNKFFYTILSLLTILRIDNCTWCSSNDFEDIKKLEGFLKKNKPLMEKIHRGKYKVNDQQFNDIFPPCAHVLGTDCNKKVGIIENKFYDIISGKLSTSLGTGAIIENNSNTVTVITAKHVLENRGDITFTLGSALVMPQSDQCSHVATYEGNGKVLFHNSEDVALIDFKLTNSNIDLNQLKSFSMLRNHQPINNRKMVGMYHYPFGVENQRFNKGFIIENDNKHEVPMNHTIPTLGGSSGAPLIINDQIIGIHSGAHEFEGGSANYQGENLEFSKHNYFVMLSKINEDLSDFSKVN